MPIDEQLNGKDAVSCPVLAAAALRFFSRLPRQPGTLQKRSEFANFSQSALLLCGVFCSITLSAHSQILEDELLSGPDAHELPDTVHGHLFGSWGGVRTHLLDRGVKLDLHYINDALWDVDSSKSERAANLGRFRGTIDVDFGKLIDQQGLSFHVTAVWQAGGNLGSYLGLIANPTGLASMNTFRLDSWWFEKRWLNSHVATRIGQFAGQDSYGHENFGKSFVMEPLDAALDNLFTDYESFDPPSTSAFEVRVAPTHNFYLKSMIEAEDRTPFANNTTGLVPQFRGTPVSISEIGFAPGKKAIDIITPKDNTDTRRGYSGLYQFGASYDPGKFTAGISTTKQPGNYLLYGIANQAVWRPDRHEAKGLDATFGYDWSPPAVNHTNATLSAGLRFNEALPVKFHNTMSFGYVQTSLSSRFVKPGNPPWKVEHGIELNVLLHVLPMMYVAPVVQYYSNVAGAAGRVIVVGFRTKIEF